MKMRYQHLKTTRRIRNFLLPLIPVGIAGILVLSHAHLPTFVVQSVHTIVRPLWILRDTLLHTSEVTFESLESREMLATENNALRNTLIELKREAYLTKTLQTENNRLHNLLNRAQKNESLLTASVIHGENYSPYDSFVIDIGTNQGVRENMLVITPENIAVGVVKYTQKETSTVTQFSAPNMTLDALLYATTSFHTVLKGYGGGTMRVSIPRDIEFSVGDTAILPSFSTYLIGEIASIEVAPQDAYKILYIRTPINTYETRHVFVDTAVVWKAPDQSTSTDAVLEEVVSDDSEI